MALDRVLHGQQPLRTVAQVLAERKASLDTLARAAIRNWGRFNPFWAERATVDIRWRGNRYVASCYYVDPNSGSRCTFHTLYETRA